MFRYLSFNQYSLSTKVIFLFFFFIVVFIAVRFFLIIPSVKQTAYENKINDITKTLIFNKTQIKMTSRAINMQSSLETQLIKKTLEKNILKILLKENDFRTTKDLKLFIDRNELFKHCSYELLEKQSPINRTKESAFFIYNDTTVLNKWIKKRLPHDKIDRKKKRLFRFYNQEIKSIDTVVSIGCNIRELNPNYSKFENELSDYIQKNLTLTEDLNKSKTSLFLVDKNILNDEEFFQNTKGVIKKQKNKLKRILNIDNASIGSLTNKQIIEATNKNPILHTIKNKEVLTWVVDISIDNSDNYFLLLHTVDKKRLEERTEDNLFILLPETLLAIAIAFILIILLFKRLFKNINTITQTAKSVNQGNKNIRSKVKGEDDVGHLGIAFDSMLDFFENSIKILDNTIKEKTDELSTSLEEKETLLREIHHRVKNNLALTIGMIELQEKDIKDKNTRKALITIKNKIYTMELLHRKLYESTNLNEIPMKEYLTDLIKMISNGYDIEEKTKIEIHIEEFDFNIQEALPFGLIINELVTNSFKYAFINNDNPKIEINISKNKNILSMIVKDNGKGLEKKLEDYFETSLGLRLINIIVKYQLYGTIDYLYEDGAKFIIKSELKIVN